MRECKHCKKPLDNSMFHPCKTGKDGLRVVCKSCVAESQREYRQKNAELISERNKQYRERNREKLKERDKAYYESNRDRVREANKAWREANKERVLAQVTAWQKANPEKVKAAKQRNKANRPYTVKAEYAKNKPAYFARAAERRAAKTSRTPTWADREAIAEYYKACRALNAVFGPGTFHVDHIVPLKHELVSGLHTDANLQMLTGKENLSKSNRYWPNMPSSIF